jgi:hypothetical protein
MDSIRLDLEYLDTVVTSGGVPVYVWNINGALNSLWGKIAKRIDMQFLHVTQTFSRVRLAQEKAGLAGVTEIDIRYHSNPKTPIIGIDPQFQSNTTSISQIAPAIATQSITLQTPTVNTQSIARGKSSLSIQTIINVNTNLWRYNLNSAPDSDWKVGDSVLIAGATSGVNNGTFVIVEVNQSGFPSIVVSNASGTAQNAAAGTVDLQLWSYNLINPANAAFVAGESAVFAAHTNALNNGTKTIYAINQGGNNIWVKDATMVAQASTPGTCQCARWVYSYSAAAPADFVAGEFFRSATHTTPANNGDFLIRAVNSGGNNIIINNPAGVAQGAAAGTANTLRWKYSFGVDPSSQVSVGQTMLMAGHTTPANNGVFTVVKINDTTANNVVVYNAAGVVQAGAVGNVTHTRKLVKFSSDQSLIYSTDSYVEIANTPDGNYRAIGSRLPPKVLEVNRGGGANYNIVIDVPNGANQVAPAGFVAVEARSIFSAADGSKPQLGVDLLGLSPNGLLKSTYTGASFVGTPIPAQTYLGLYILRVQNGEASNLSVMLT